MFKRILLMLIVSATLWWAPARVFAHGQPQITVTPDIIAPGGKITVKGVTMGANEQFRISLEGLKFRADLGVVKSDASEKFTAAFAIPSNVPAGDYLVKALSEDGDAATADLSVTAPLRTATPARTASPAATNTPAPTLRPGQTAAPTAIAAPTETPVPTATPTEEPMPSAAEHQLPRSRSPIEVFGLFATVALSAGAGLVLVRWR